MTTPPPYIDIWCRGQNDPLLLRAAILRQRLVETIVWCDALESMKDLRYEAISPRLMHDGPDDLICDVGNSRQSHLRFRSLAVSQSGPIVASGRFLLYFPDEDLCDGAAQAASDGFFDVHNLPAYDTWISFFVEEGRTQRSSSRYLLSYVPPSMLSAADAGVEVNPEECILWLDRSDVAMRSIVERAIKQR
jgi:hypothetical protein